MTPPARDDVRFRALRLALARMAERWYAVLAFALGAGCGVAVLFRIIVAGRSWENTAQGIAFFLALLGLVMGVMLAYGGRGSMNASHRDRHGDRLRGVRHPAKPLAGFAEVLFCLPIVVATLTM